MKDDPRESKDRKTEDESCPRPVTGVLRCNIETEDTAREKADAKPQKEELACSK